jgi:IS30 family transposase
MSNYRRIRYEDRCQIYALSKRGASQESIAEVLGVSQSAVSREMSRNRGQRGYRFKQAEARAQARQVIRSKPRKLTAPLRRDRGKVAPDALVAGADQRLALRTGHQPEP